MSVFTISSPAFSHMGMIPPKYTCHGDDIIPPLNFEGVPEGTESFALIMDDPDAPSGTWVHWVVWNMGKREHQVEEGTAPTGAVEGTNSWGRKGYGGPCPPSGTHRYFFKLYALDSPIDLKPGATKKDLEESISGHVLGKAELVGRYGRQK